MHLARFNTAAMATALSMAALTQPAYGFAIPGKDLTTRVIGMSIANLVIAVQEFLKTKNAWDPSIPDKCEITVTTTAGGNCQTYVNCDRTDTWGPVIGGWSVCYLGGRQYFTHPDLGDFSVTFTQAGGVNGNTQDGLHHPVLQFKDLNNWEPMKVQDIIDATPAGAGQLCGFDIQGEGQELIWTCGLPKLSKVATSAFGINLMEPDSNKQGYKKGWCTAHVIQYQKNEFGTGNAYAFGLQIFDAAGDQIGHIQKQTVDKNGKISMDSKLPLTLELSSKKLDSDPVSFCYGSQCWTCDGKGGPHDCTLGNGADNGYENGDREGDMGWTC